MSHPNETPPPPPSSSSSKPPSLHKHKSLTTDFYREEAWLRRKENQHHHHRHRRSKSLVTSEDIDELKGCLELGFHFAAKPTKLSKKFPALDLYYATVSPLTRSTNSSATSSNDGDSPPQPCSPHNTATALFNSGEDPEMVKKRLKQWAQVVACAARKPPCCPTEPKD